MTGKQLLLAIPLALAAACSAPQHLVIEPPPSGPVTVRIVDAEKSGSLLASLLTSTWRFFPSEKDLDAHRAAGTFARWSRVEDQRFSHRDGIGNVLLLEELRGDFRELRVFCELLDDGQLVNRGCQLTPRPSSEPGATLRSELAKLGLEPGDAELYTPKLGVLYATSKPYAFAMLEKRPDGEHLAALYVTQHRNLSFVPTDTLTAADLAADGRARLEFAARQGRPDEWIENAAAAGMPQAVRLIAEFRAESGQAVAKVMAQHAACPADAPPAQRLAATTSLAQSLLQIAPAAPATATALSTARTALADAYARVAAERRAADEAGVAAMFEWLAEDARALPDPTLVAELAEHAWTLDWLERWRAGTPEQRLAIHAGLALDVRFYSDKHRLARKGLELERQALAAAFERSGRRAAERGLHATAAGELLIADWLANGNRGWKKVDLAGAALPADGPMILRQAARASALELLGRTLPCVGPLGGRLVTWDVDFDFLANLALGDRDAFGLDTRGRDDVLAFGKQHGLPQLTISVTPPVLADLKVEKATEERSADYTDSVTRSNDAAVDSWLKQLNDLAGQIAELDERIGHARAESGRVTGTTNWQWVLPGERYNFVTDYSGESMASAIARVQAMGRVDSLTEERDKLQQRFQAVNARRPAGSRVEFVQRKLRCAIEYQVWTAIRKSTVRIEGGKEPFELQLDATSRWRLARNAASPALGIEARDEWTTEAAVRADTKRAEELLPPLACYAAQQYFSKQVAALRAEIVARTMDEGERQHELEWFDYLLTPRKVLYDTSVQGPSHWLANARFHW